ncbi:hypothetical protein EC973_005794 [Apophysomyces ossiformis]|uniref:Uncharacterized protein n=1 Tax=Apophysomyces ossiformis TaxID=679940 RepID=A0A8H7BH20_9FUNG|nr:hypothetical protein EC973_005794 [Apophysomyces ossiformis]
MAVTWDAVTWLKANYIQDNGVPQFFIQGKYLPNQRDIAEIEFKNTVKQLYQSSDNGDLCAWAKKVIDSDYRCLNTSTAVSFWQHALLRGNIVNEFYQQEELRFEVVGPSNYQSKRKISGNEELVTKRRIQAGAKIVGMNNVVDMTDESSGSQLYALSRTQQSELRQILDHQPNYERLDQDNDGIYDIIKKYSNNKKHAIDKLYGKLKQATPLSSQWILHKMVIFLLEIYCYDSYLLDLEFRPSLSEADYIIKFWGPLIDILLKGSSVWAHWGDTIAISDQKLNLRMDLRLLCKSISSGHDTANGEFGKTATVNKYYGDKLKLVLNGKNQLNHLLKEHHGDAKDVKICLLQVLGFEAELYYMWIYGDGVYVLQRLKTFTIPTVRSDLAKDIGNLVDGLSTMKCLAENLSNQYHDNLNHKKRKLAAITSAGPDERTPSWTRSVWTPPCLK